MKPNKLYRMTFRDGSACTVSGASLAAAKRAIGPARPIKIETVGYVEPGGAWIYSERSK